MDEPIVIIKPSICTKGRQEDNEYVVEKTFINDEDKCLDKDEFNIIMVWNGLDYYAPAMQATICEVSDDLTFCKSQLGDALQRCVELEAKLPTSKSKEMLSKSILHMRAAKDMLRCTQVTTGTAHNTTGAVASLPVPLPSRGKVMHTRACPHPRHPKKKQKTAHDDNVQGAEGGDGNQDEDEGETPENPDEEESEAVYAGRLADTCACSAPFKNASEVDKHVKLVHFKSWSCSGQEKDNKTGEMKPCNQSYPKSDRLWKHYRKIHLGLYHYMCPYKIDGKDCDKKMEERAGWL